jgi:putative tricarboxylic transport membrane protein
MRISDFAAGCACALFGLALLGYGYSLPPMPGQRYGAGLFPMLLGASFFLCGALLAWRAERRTAPVTLASWVRDPKLAGNFVWVLGSIVVYVLLDERIGFIPLSLVLLVALFWRLGVPLVKSSIIAVLSTAFLYIAFARFLRVPLPRGLLEGIVW